MTAPPELALLENVPHGATARRLDWPYLPPMVRRLVEDDLGAPVVDYVSQDSGFTPGFASRLTAANGARLFVKAASTKAQRPFAESYAEEARKHRLLPAGVPAPRLAWAHEDDLWVVLAFECVDGEPPARPWRRADLMTCLETLAEVAELLDPVPAALGLRPVTSDVPGLVSGWDHVRTVEPDRPHLEEAAALARSHDDFPGNDAFVHTDARDDNFLLTGARALLCDWNWPALGPRWLDAVYLLVSAYGEGVDTDAILADHPLTRDADPEHVDAALAMLAGMMLQARSRPTVRTSPYLRVHANWWAEASWAWLAERRGWR